AAQGIDVFRTDETSGASDPARTKAGATTTKGATYPAGSYIVPVGQPTERLIKNLLDGDVPMDPVFLKKQEERRARLLPDQFYDITTWSLPALFDVDCVLSDAAITGKRSRFDAGKIDAP